MSITLTYDATVARVIIDADGLGAALTAHIERSTNLTTWKTIRGGLDVSVTAGALDLPIDDYEFIPDVENFYRVTTAVSVLGGMILDGTGDYASTPDHASLDIVGDIDIRAEIAPADWTPAARQTILAKWTPAGNQRSYQFSLATDGKLVIRWSTDGTAITEKISTIAVTPPGSGPLAVRVTLDVNNGAAGNDVKFYTATDINGSWTQLGTTVTTAGVTSIFASTGILEVGSREVGTAELFIGRIYKIRLLNGITGLVDTVARPEFATQKEGVTSFIDATGKVWTLNGNAAIIDTYDAITPILSATWLKSIARPFLNQSFMQSEIVSDASRPERDGVFDIIGRSLPVSVTDVRTSLQYNLRLVTRTLGEANALDMLLASGDTLFLHVPSTWPLPSAYVAVANAPRTFRWSTDWSTWTLTIKEVAAPGADIVGSLNTYQTVLSTYASYSALLFAHSDYADVLTLIGSPSEVIVP